MKNKLLWIGWIFLFILPCSPFLQTTTFENQDSLTLEEKMELYETMEMEAELLDTFDVKEVEVEPVEEMIFKSSKRFPRYFSECKSEKLTMKELSKCHEEAFLKNIYKYLKYPLNAKQYKIEGSVIVQFNVEKDDTIQDIKIIKDIGGGCGDEVKRILQLLNTMKVLQKRPRKSREMVAKTRFILPIKFEIIDSLTVEEEMDLYETMEMEAEQLDTFEIKEVEEEPEEETIFKIVEELPRFFQECDPEILSRKEMSQCHEEQFLKNIYKHLEYPEVARQLNIEGTVIAQFVVEKDGSIYDVRILKDIGGGCGDEVKRIFQLIDESREVAKWTPGKSRGKPVKVQWTLPIEFKL